MQVSESHVILGMMNEHLIITHLLYVTPSFNRLWAPNPKQTSTKITSQLLSQSKTQTAWPNQVCPKYNN